MKAPVQRKWLVHPPIPADISLKLKDFDPMARQILFNRGICDSESAVSYLSAAYTAESDPFLLKGMHAAVERIQQAVTSGESIAVYGDYDVDGVTATALLVECLGELGGIVKAYIPNRFEEGYGVNRDALVNLRQEGIDLVITVDCGARSPGEAQVAKSIGLDLIITDHHAPGNVLPDVTAVINPKQVDDSYPDKELAGVGLAYKLVEALAQTNSTMQPEKWLDLVALGTVADMVLLIGENRNLVKRGLFQIQRGGRQGIASLAAVAGLDVTNTTASNIGFVLGPRLNAAGRLQTALDAFNLLISRDPQETGLLSQQLQKQNQERRMLMIQTQEKAQELAFLRKEDPWVLFACSPDFNEGVIGLAASRLVDRYYRPAIVGTIKGDTTRFSCRSIPELHITNILDGMSDLFIRHGGHSAAAGLSIQTDRIEEFNIRLEESISHSLQDKNLFPVIDIDKEMRLEELRPREFFDLAERMEPIGNGNPEIILASRHVKCKHKVQVGKDKQTLKLTLMQGGVTYDAIAFRFGDQAADLGEYVDLAYTVGLDNYPRSSGPRVQLFVKDIRTSER